MSQQGDVFKLLGIVSNNSYNSEYSHYCNQNLPILDDTKYVHMVITSKWGLTAHATELKGHILASLLLARIYYFIILSTKTERYHI